MFDKSHNLGRVISIPAPTTVTEVLAQAVRRNPDHPFLKCEGRETTTGELQAASERVAGALLRWGVSPGDRVAVMMANVPEFLDVWFGIVRCRATEVPVHSAYRGPLLEHILGESGARILFCYAEFVDRLAEVRAPALERVVVRGDRDGNGRGVRRAGVAPRGRRPSRAPGLCAGRRDLPALHLRDDRSVQGCRTYAYRQPGAGQHQRGADGVHGP